MIYSIYFCDWFDRPQTSRLMHINYLSVLWCQIRNFLLDNPDFSLSQIWYKSEQNLRFNEINDKEILLGLNCVWAKSFTLGKQSRLAYPLLILVSQNVSRRKWAKPGTDEHTQSRLSGTCQLAENEMDFQRLTPPRKLARNICNVLRRVSRVLYVDGRWGEVVCWTSIADDVTSSRQMHDSSQLSSSAAVSSCSN